MTRLNRLTDELLKRIAWFVAGWAAATAAAFFYLLRAATGREGPGASEASHSVGGRR